MKPFYHRILAILVVTSRACAFVAPGGPARVSLYSARPLKLSAQKDHLDKDPYQASKVQGEDFDAVVIGSGVGGLTAASLIAQSGKKVCVLEQHYVAGGACHTFTKRGYTFATGKQNESSVYTVVTLSSCLLTVNYWTV